MSKLDSALINLMVELAPNLPFYPETVEESEPLDNAKITIKALMLEAYDQARDIYNEQYEIEGFKSFEEVLEETVNAL